MAGVGNVRGIDDIGDMHDGGRDEIGEGTELGSLSKLTSSYGNG